MKGLRERIRRLKGLVGNSSSAPQTKEKNTASVSLQAKPIDLENLTKPSPQEFARELKRFMGEINVEDISDAVVVTASNMLRRIEIDTKNDRVVGKDFSGEVVASMTMSNARSIFRSNAVSASRPPGMRR